MKRLLILGAAALSFAGIATLGGSPAKADEGCTVAIHVHVTVNGDAQGQDLCLPEGLVVPSAP